MQLCRVHFKTRKSRILMRDGQAWGCLSYGFETGSDQVSSCITKCPRSQTCEKRWLIRPWNVS
jgi:hypothetical protein